MNLLSVMTQKMVWSVRKWCPCLGIAHHHFLLELSYVLTLFLLYLLHISYHLEQLKWEMNGIALIPVKLINRNWIKL